MSTLAFGLYLLFICSWFLHLPARFDVPRVDLVLVCAITALCVIVSASAPAPPQRGHRRLLWVLVIYAVLTTPLVEWPGSVVKTGFPEFAKAFVFYFFTTSLVTTTKRLKYLLIFFLACQSFRILEPLYLHVTEGYWGSSASLADWDSMDRLSGAPYDVVNPNGLAFIVLTVIPFLHYLTVGRVAARVLYITLLPAFVYVLLLTASRSGLIGLAAIVMLVWLKSSHKVLMAMVLAVAVAFTIPRLSEDLTDRYLSLVTDGTRNAGTAQGRVTGLKRDVEVVMRKPLFGHGLGTSEEANANYGGSDAPSHNLYAQVAQELGLVGLLIFLLFIRSLLIGLRTAAATVESSPGVSTVARGLVPALQVWIGMSLLFSLASYGLSSYEWYLSAGLVEVLTRLSPLPQKADAASTTTESTPALHHALRPVASGA